MSKSLEGARIKELREGKGWSQTYLAQKVGVTYQIIGKIENGTIKAPSGKTLYNLAKALDTTVDYLMGGIGFSKSKLPEMLHRKIPILNWEEAPEWCKSDIKNISEEGHSFINPPVKFDGEGIFAIKITTDAMEGYGSKQVPKGSVAIFSPVNEAKPNRFILFYDENVGSSVLREAVLEDKLYLKPINAQYRMRAFKTNLIPIAEVIGIYFPV